MLLKKLGSFLVEILQVVVFAISIFLFIYLLVMQPHKIKGSSMEPNFHDGEYLLTDKVSYRFGEPKRGDVVVFKAPTNNGEEFIKRIIALPGEQVSIKNSRISINGTPLEETYIAGNVITSGGGFLAEGATVSVGQGEYFVLGDNRPHSSDSRAWGFVEKKEITGRAWLVYWPPKSAGVITKVKYNL